MRDPKRIPQVLEEIRKIWEKYPDMRLGQLIGNGLEGPNLYYVEDEGLVKALKDMYEGAEEPVKFDEDAYIFDLVKKHPDELGFVLQSKDYEEYVNTFVDAGGKIEDATLTDHEFAALKHFFCDKKD